MSLAPLVTANGAHIPAIGLGTWPHNGAACVRIVTTALECGYRHLDTAQMYGNEEAIGEALRHSAVKRDDVWITTKAWWTDIGDGPMQRACEASLRKLGLSSVDLYLIHWPNSSVPLEQSIRALCEIKRRGLARHIGVSNFNTRMLAQSLKLATEPLAAIECEYHVRLDQTRLLDACRKAGMAFISYSPLGKGVIAGGQAEKLLLEIGERHGKTPAQVALRWLVQQPGVLAIPSSSNPQRIKENIDVFDFSLSDGEMQGIAKLARRDGRVLSPSFAPDWD